jgi:hypothetical protein
LAFGSVGHAENFSSFGGGGVLGLLRVQNFQNFADQVERHRAVDLADAFLVLRIDLEVKRNISIFNALQCHHG